jgi:hypothetical protein
MKGYNTLYYLLFVLIVMGAFASMAQNDYGTAILGLASASFSVVFLIQLVSLLFFKSHPGKFSVLELIGLFVLSAILAMRVFYIHFQFVEFVFGTAGILLVLVYIMRMIQLPSTLKLADQKFIWLIRIFYGSVVLYLISMITVPFLAAVSEPTGIAGFVLLILFGIVSLISKTILSNGEKISGFQFVAQAKDRSGVLAILFLLFTVYMGFSKIGMIPPLYSDEFPQSYYKLVNQAETGKEKPVNGRYRHEEFKAMYDKLVNRHLESEKK